MRSDYYFKNAENALQGLSLIFITALISVSSNFNFIVMATGGAVALLVAFRGVFYSKKRETRKLNQILATLLEEGVQEKGVTLLLNPRLLLGHKQQLFVIWGRTQASGGQGLNVQLWLRGYNQSEGPSLKADWSELTPEVREKILSSQEGEDFFLHPKSYYAVQQ